MASWMANITPRSPGGDQLAWNSLSRPKQIVTFKRLWSDFMSLSNQEQVLSVNLNEIVDKFVQIYLKQQSDLEATFSEIPSFSYSIAKRLATNIQSFVGSKDMEKSQIATEAMAYLQAEGYAYAQACAILAQTSALAAEQMAKVRLPSLLVRVFWIVMQHHVPSPSSEPAHHEEPPVGEVISSILKHLCKKAVTIRELTESHSIIDLVNMLVFRCSVENEIWRERLSTDGHLVTYLFEKGCISTLLNNLNKISMAEVVIVVNMVARMIQQSVPKFPELYSSMSELEGYALIGKLIAGNDPNFDFTDDNKDKILASLESLIYVGPKPIELRKMALSPFLDPKFKLPSSVGEDVTIKNLQAFAALKTTFQETSSTFVRGRIIGMIERIFSTNPINYYIAEEVNIVSVFLEQIERLPSDLQLQSLNILRTIVSGLSYIPIKELVSLSMKCQDPIPMPSLTLVDNLIREFMKGDPNFLHVFREVGLLDVLCAFLLGFVEETEAWKIQIMESSQVTQVISFTNNQSLMNKMPRFALLTDTLLALLENNRPNIEAFRKKVRRNIYCLLNYEETRPTIFRFFRLLVVEELDSAIDVAKLIEIIQSNHSMYHQMKIETLQVIQETFDLEPTTQASFVEYSGLVCLASIIVNQEGTFTDASLSPLSFALMTAVFNTLTELFKLHPKAKVEWREQVGYPSLHSAVHLTKVLSTPFAKDVFDLVLTLIVGDTSAYPLISRGQYHEEVLRGFRNPDAISALLFELLPLADEALQFQVLTKVSNLLSLSFSNKVESAKAGLGGALIRHYSYAIVPSLVSPPKPSSASRPSVQLQSAPNSSLVRGSETPEHPFQETVFGLLAVVAPLYITCEELRDLFNLFDHTGEIPLSTRLLALILRCVKQSRMPDFVQFDLSRPPHHGAIAIRSVPNWPPASGYTFCCWLRFVKVEPGASLTLLTVTEDHKVAISFELTPNKTLSFRKEASVHEFASFAFMENTWYHLAVVHSKGKMVPLNSPSTLSLYIDGIHADTVKFAFLGQGASGQGTTSYSSPNPAVSITFGHEFPQKHNKPPVACWNLGPSFFLEEALDMPRINAVYNLGPRFVSNFQGPITKYYTNEVIDSINLDAVGKTTEMASMESGHAIFAVENLMLPEDKIIFALHPHNLVRSESLQAVFYENLTSANFGTPPSQGRETENNLFIWNSAIIKPTTKQWDRCGLLLGTSVVLSHNDFSESIRKIGGIPIILRLVELSEKEDSLNLSVDILVNMIKFNWFNTTHMEKYYGYDILSSLLQKKKKLINPQLFQTILSLIGKAPDNRSDAVIANRVAYRHLMLDFQFWRDLPLDLQRLFFTQMYDFILNSSQSNFNIYRLLKSHIIRKLLTLLQQEILHEDLLNECVNVIRHLLKTPASHAHSDLISRFLVVTLSMVEKAPKKAKRAEPDGPFAIRFRKVILNAKEGTTQNTPRMIKIRNSMIDMLIFSMSEGDEALMDKLIKGDEDPLRWLLYFLDEEVNSHSVVLAVRLLCKLLIARPTLVPKFRAMQGFTILRGLLLAHWYLFQLYHVLFALFFGIDIKYIPLDCPIDATSFARILEEARENSPTIFCPEAMDIILAMAKRGIDTTLLAYQNLMREEETTDSILRTASSSFTIPASALAASSPSRLELANPNDYTKQNEWCKNSSVSLDSILQLERFVIDLIQDRYTRVQEVRDYCFKGDFFENFASLCFPSLFSEDLGVQFMDPREDLGYPIEATVLFPPNRKTGSVFDQFFVQALREHYMGFYFMVAKDLALGAQKSAVASLEILLDSCTPTVDPVLQNIFVSRILFHLVDDFRKMIGPRMPGGDTPPPLRESRFASNLVKFCNQAVDRVRQDWFINGSEIMFHFLSETLDMLDLEELNYSSGGGHTMTAGGLKRLTRVGTKDELLGSLFKVFNRVVLHQFDTSSSEQSKLELATRIIYNQKIVLNNANVEPDFLRAFCYNLYLFLRSDDDLVKGISMNLWKLVIQCRPADTEQMLKTKAKNVDPTLVLDNFKKLAGDQGNPQEKVNQQFLEFVGGKDKVNPEVQQVMEENLGKVYQAVKAQEAKITNEGKAATNTKKQARVKKEQKDDRAAGDASATHASTTLARYGSLIEEEAAKFSRYEKENGARASSALEVWGKQISQLQQECGVWGHAERPHLRRWKLDLTEGPMRMRKKLEPNEGFYVTYPQNPHDIPENTDYRPASSYHTQEYLATVLGNKKQPPPVSPGPLTPVSRRAPALSERESSGSFSLLSTTLSKDSPGKVSLEKLVISNKAEAANPAAEEDGFEALELEEPPKGGKKDSSDLQSADEADKGLSDEEFEEKGEGEAEEAPEGQADEGQPLNKVDQSVKQILQEKRAIDIYNCARISALDICEGIFVIAEHELLIIDNFFKKPNGDIVPISEVPIEGREYALLVAKSHEDHLGPAQKNSYPFKEIREIHKRRYLLRGVALEIFQVNGRNSLVAFDSAKVRDLIHNRSVSRVRASMVSAVEARAADAAAVSSRLQSFLLGASSLTDFTAKWERREITNFEYLMQLNTLAGRSYNDLTQYPVFPWILRDYTSEYLDLNNPAIYRDLSKPMGAQSPVRLEDFVSRFQEMEDDPGTPRFHYGTHYSSAMTVCLYLIRLEPFTQEFLKLQDNHFDRPDRMFHSLGDAWESASQINAIDVRELVPEFFYLPEVLMNQNRFDFGTRENKVRIDNVVLPPWAKGDPHLFVKIHRQALESEFVSANLHNWIDLIFGYKQRGKAAEEACNLFHPLSYEGQVDIDKITDPVEKMATIGIINNFGQTPAQLFKRQHPARLPLPAPMRVTVPLSLPPQARFKSVLDLDSLADDEAVGNSLSSSGLSFVSVPNPEKLVPSFAFSPQKLVQSAAPFREIERPVRYLDFKTDRIMVYGPRQLPVPTNPNKYVEWGFLDNSIRLISAENNRALVVYESAHLGQVTAAVFASDDRLITGGEDTVVSVWRINKRQRQELKPMKDLCGHLAPITSLAVSSAYSFIVSGSVDGTCIIWDLNQLRYIRTLRGHEGPVNVISINEATGDIATCSGTQLRVWNVNGVLLAKANTSTAPNGTILACCFLESHAPQGDLIFTAHENSKIRIWTLLHASERHADHLHFDHSKVEAGNGNAQTDWTLEFLRNIDVVGNRDIPGKGSRTKNPRITAITVVADQKRIYTGDSSGCVYAWSFPDSDDRHWVKDSSVESCMACGQVKFTVVRERKHHCRSCGGIFCANCSRFDADIPDCVNIPRPVKQCENCYNQTSVLKKE